MWNPKPSATSVTPMSSRNARASILTDGWSCTNFASGPDATSITRTAITTAAIMTRTSSAMPTAVSTESSENTMSSRTIWTSTLAHRGRRRIRRDVVGGFALERLADLGRGLPEQEDAAADEDEVAPRELVAVEREHGRRQADDPRDGQQQRDAHAHREAESDVPGPVAVVGRQALDEDRDEDDVVDAEHDLEHREGDEGDPDLGVGRAAPSIEDTVGRAEGRRTMARP